MSPVDEDAELQLNKCEFLKIAWILNLVQALEAIGGLDVFGVLL